MSESSVYYDSDEDDSRKEDCALVDAVSELNFEDEQTTGFGVNSSENISNLTQSDENPGSSNASLNVFVEDDYMHDSEWINQKSQVFILSTAGKPIYSLHGSEEKLNTLFGLLQALVSVVSSSNDSIRYAIKRKTIIIEFLIISESSSPDPSLQDSPSLYS